MCLRDTSCCRFLCIASSLLAIRNIIFFNSKKQKKVKTPRQSPSNHKSLSSSTALHALPLITTRPIYGASLPRGLSDSTLTQIAARICFFFFSANNNLPSFFFFSFLCSFLFRGSRIGRSGEILRSLAIIINKIFKNYKY